MGEMSHHFRLLLRRDEPKHLRNAAAGHRDPLLQIVRRGHLQIELAAEQSDVFVRKIEMKLLLSYQSARESL